MLVVGIAAAVASVVVADEFVASCCSERQLLVVGFVVVKWDAPPSISFDSEES